MIYSIKNTSIFPISWDSGLGQLAGSVLTNIEYWSAENYPSLCQFATEGTIEIKSFDGSIIGLSDALGFAYEKQQRIASGGDYPIIYDMVAPWFQGMPFHAIDYKRNLLSGVKLHPIFEFSIDGLLEKTTYFFDFQNSENPGIEVLKVESAYTTDVSNPIPAAAQVIERETERTWMNTNGLWHPETKVTPKKYDTQDKRNKEGERRRLNLRRISQDKIGTALILSGEASSAVEAQDIMIGFYSQYAGQFNTYGVTGTGSIYGDIGNDVVNGWLDAIVPDNEIIPEFSGQTLRNASINKLKGLI